MMTQRLKKIAIVGGGVSGLLSLRHILRYPHLRPTLFEGTNNIGGVWVYDVCNGHFTTPNIPQLPGLEHFRGKTLHSRYYRHPEDFYDKTVLVIGAGISGLDIALDISRFSKKNIFVSNRGEPLSSQLPTNMYEVSEVSHFNDDGHSVTLADGKTISVDTVIFTTGFLFDYPFLDENCGITVNDNRVTHLFKHIVNIRHPSMLFVGIPNWTPQFPLLYFQAVYISKILANEISLPTVDKMLLDESHDFKLRTDQGWPPSKAHNMFGISFKYLDYLADTSCVEKMPNYLKNIHNHVVKTRMQDVINFKNVTYQREDFE